MLNVTQWRMVPGSDIPEPVITDDRAKYPASLVTNILAWLESQKAEHIAKHRPTDQLITLARPGDGPQGGVQFIGSAEAAESSGTGRTVKFECGTFELILRDKKTRTPLVKYHYLHARNRANGDTIAGPVLWSEVVGKIQ